MAWNASAQLRCMTQKETKITNIRGVSYSRHMHTLISHRFEAALEDTNKVSVNHFVESATYMQHNRHGRFFRRFIG